MLISLKYYLDLGYEFFQVSKTILSFLEVSTPL